MRTTVIRALVALLGLSTPAFAAAGGEGGGANLLSPSGGLMFWTLVIFLILFIILSKAAFPKILGAVEARERALADAIEGAKRDRDEAARPSAITFWASARAAAERLRHEMLEQARQQQQEMLERARQDIARERDRAIADLRREAVDLAIAGASKVIEHNLDDESNRRLVETFLASVPAASGSPAPGSRR